MTPIRRLLRLLSLLMAILTAAPALAADAAPSPVPIKWLDPTPPPIAQGISWGVPWPRGAVKKDQSFTLLDAGGKSLPLQLWPLAYWPDGSIKWTGLATVAGPDIAGPLQLSPVATSQPSRAESVSVQETAQTILIDTGYLQCRISRQGEFLFDSMTIGGREVAHNARLECLLQKGPEVDAANPPPREDFTSNVTHVTVEQSGPVRAVVKIEGMHKSKSTERQWLPFTVRLYFFAGQTPVRMVHSFVFDGDQQQDFIRGLGILFTVPMKEEIQNRQVRFGGDAGGLWSEPVEPLLGFNRRVSYPTGGDVYVDQIAGKRLPDKKDLDANSQHTLDALAVWDDFRLIQPNAQGFTVEKRTSNKSAWIPAGSGKRSSGLVFVGDVSGGLAVGVKDFWQKYPAELEIKHAKYSDAEMRIWLWTPDAPAMDMRHYDTIAHGLNESYEDVQPGLSTATGVARTSELTLFPSAQIPTKEETARQAASAQTPAMLVCTPEYLHSARAFGIWSLQDRSTPFKAAVENQLDAEIAYYEKAVDQWNWYGFWDFGDIMHSYDPVRHVWRYDVGGFAWDNDEQCTDMWLWYSFLRTGRADIFRMAQAMTRHTSEVDCYHMGNLMGLGSRHNVRHWGDGAKEARISQAAYRRFFYYLTTDERTGDVMTEMLAADHRVADFDSMREVSPPVPSDKQYPARVRAGPDWLALVGNWMTAWERTNDTSYRDKIYAGIDSISQMPYWFQTSPYLLWGFDPATGKLFARQQTRGGYNLVNNMGGPEVIFELNEFVDNAAWQKIWLQYCRLSGAPDDMLIKDKQTGEEGATGQYAGGGRMAGYAYLKTHNPAFAQRALGGVISGQRYGAEQHLQGADLLHPLDEDPAITGIITNTVNQTSLQTIEVLDMIADQLPHDPPPAAGRGAGRRGGGRGRGTPNGARGLGATTIPTTAP
jgi:hypothetical protein